jgi:hypothetical protein
MTTPLTGFLFINICLFAFVTFHVNNDIHTSSGNTLPTVQMAFAYYCLESREGEKPRLRKRLRLLTNQVVIANYVREVYNGAEAAASLNLLLNKVFFSLEGSFETSHDFI